MRDNGKDRKWEREQLSGASLSKTERKALVARVECALVRGAEQYFQNKGFVWVPSVPHVVSVTGACENVNTLYDLSYHGREAFLTQTGQTALEEMVQGLHKVCTIIHSFRKEETVDNRHLTEFPLVEFEFRYHPGIEDGFEALLSYVEETIAGMVDYALKTEKSSLHRLGADIGRLERLQHPFKRISYDKATKMLGLKWGSDLKSQHETELMKNLGDVPVFVTRYPTAIKFFNMQENKDNPLVVDSADLLLPPGGESVGSAVREHNYKSLVRRLDSSEMMRILRTRGKDINDFESYLSVVRENPIPHAGCGIGLNRVMQFVLNEQDIRKVTPYPMNKENLY
ncbi:MAG: amino acid--tRNA ligase-related protein [archaeon]